MNNNNENNDKKSDLEQTLSDFGNLNNFLNSKVKQDLDKFSEIQNNIDIEDTFQDDGIYSLINNTNNKNEQSQLEYSNILPNESQLNDLTM